MSDTVAISVPNDDWVDVTNGGTDGLISNEGNQRIKLLEDATKPIATSSDGHTLHPDNSMRFAVAGSQKIWAKCMGNNGSRVCVTVD